jgi:hypothetical protein
MRTAMQGGIDAPGERPYNRRMRTPDAPPYPQEGAVRTVSRGLVVPLSLIALAIWLGSLLLAGGCTKTVIQQVSVTATPETVATKPQPTPEEDAQARVYETLGTASLWSASTDLTMELERLLEPDNLSSPGDAIWYSMSTMVDCSMAKENVPGLWAYVSDECAAVGAAGAAGIMTLVDDGDYEQAHRLAEAVGNASDEHLVGLAGPAVPTLELYTTASLASHGGDLARELGNLVSGSTDSTPKAAILLSLDVAVDCDMAQDSPPLWSSVADDCGSATTGSLPNLVVLIDSGRYGEAFDQAVLLRDNASSHLLSLMRSTP